MRKLAGLMFAAAMGCGTLQGPTGGSDNVPVSGGGPFRLLAADASLKFEAPRVLTDLLGDYDHPVVLPRGEELGMWLTLEKNGTTTIQHTHAEQLAKGFESPVLALAAEQAWEGDRVFAPSLVELAPGPSGQYLMFYATGMGTIGLATAPDAHAWQKRSAPIFAPSGRSVSLPSAVKLDDRLRLYYAEAGAIWAVDAALADVLAGNPTWQELDGDGSTTLRDPMIALSDVPFMTSLGRPHARAGKTPSGRLRHDLYLGGVDALGQPVSAFASSFVGSSFEVFKFPIAPEGVTSPMAFPDGARALLFAVDVYLDHRVIVVGQSP